MEPFNGLFLNCSCGIDFALGKPLPEYVYFAVEMCHRRPLPSATPGFRFGKNFANQQNIKGAVALGWGRQIWKKSSQTMGIAAVTVNACQRNMKTHTRRKFSPCSRSFIMNGRGFYCNPAQF